MAVRIQLRRDTAANWVSENPVLAEGEIGFETNTSQFKIGDGVNGWLSLDYFASGGGSGTVTDVTVVTANGFAGSVATSTTTPAITIQAIGTAGILTRDGSGGLDVASTTGTGS